eukprot:CAMPEP_0114340734 /NCGR_PEP_ID=MMETSP0101-20121206/8571_1 /TAXON_ID=38822 ORGANISM="Pteridomonas danica, Strain PT" /NCGR_SAMPLE_ID=MMETSP0101 /ASSEMBLY_ACC=CAM_ASM_000211 /LENGTH=221 /DNA_ID=CAMNT_0001474089 /DNA_START=523 /DNA_END=1185 /DNA_ORIENTATION=+
MNNNNNDEQVIKAENEEDKENDVNPLIGCSALTRYRNRPGAQYFESTITSARLLLENELFYDITYDDGDFEIGVPWTKVRPLPRLLKKSAEELKVGDETIASFHGKKHMKFLGTVTERNGNGEKVKYNIRYEDGDEENNVKRIDITPIDLILFKNSTPPPSSSAMSNSKNNDNNHLDNKTEEEKGSSSSSSPPSSSSWSSSWQPLEVGTQVMSAARGYEKW